MIENKKSPLNESTFLAISRSAVFADGYYQWQVWAIWRVFFEKNSFCFCVEEPIQIANLFESENKRSCLWVV
jgi:hypothetical protein